MFIVLCVLCFVYHLCPHDEYDVVKMQKDTWKHCLSTRSASAEGTHSIFTRIWGWDKSKGAHALEKWLMNSVNNMHHSTFKSVGGLWIVYHTRSSQVLLNVLPQILIRHWAISSSSSLLGAFSMYSLWSSGVSGFIVSTLKYLIRWMMMVLAYNETTHLATDHISTSIGGSSGGNTPGSNSNARCSLFRSYHIARLGHVFHFRFWCLNKRPRMVTCIYNTRAEHKY